MEETPSAAMSTTDGPPVRPHGRKRIVLIAAVAVVAVALVAGGWYASALLQSPAQREAAASAPSPATITTEVTRGDLSTTVTSRGTVARQSTSEVALAGQSAGAVVTGAGAGAGQTVSAGAKLLEVNGRPLVALPGSFPLYRDLAEGDEGPDVRELQQGLDAAGLDVTADGIFGKSTTQAVELLYSRLGYPGLLRETDTNDGSASAGSVAAAEEPPAGTTEGNRQSGAPEDDADPAAVVLPMTDVLVVQALPATLGASPAVGTRLDAESSIAFAQGPRVVRGSLASTSGGSVRPGMPVTLSVDGASRPGTVLSATAGTDGKEGSVTVECSDAECPDEWTGSDVLISVQLKLSAKNALIVPTRAVVTGTTSYVLRLKGDAEIEKVPVEEIATLAGRSAVAPTRDGALKAGDLIVVR